MESEKSEMFYIAVQFTLFEQSNRRGQHSVFFVVAVCKKDSSWLAGVVKFLSVRHYFSFHRFCVFKIACPLLMVQNHSFVNSTRNSIHAMLEGSKLQIGVTQDRHISLLCYIYIGQLLLLTYIHWVVMKGKDDPRRYCDGNLIQPVAAETKIVIPSVSWQTVKGFNSLTLTPLLLL